ncbi:MAG: hypothetical protein HQ512_10960 [Rhodospirillales bacterium]|nr:hypothetical protein [Rhodospirillales bacterium]
MRFAAAVLFVALMLVARAGTAAELVMFMSPLCEWCERWEQEVGVVYDKTPEARTAPVRRIDVLDPMPQEFKKIKPVIYTPTFVMMEDGREIGRVLGYPGEAHFWGLMEELIGKLDHKNFACEGAEKRLAGDTPTSKDKSLC